MRPITRHCAIYTRKSTEEGLEQDFNSLDAQRESCLAYILSQKAEGWVAVKTNYDDGGFTGGNMNRPGLQRLMEDIKARKVNIVVVYKIDRLTRSLMDFAKLVEIFDQYNVTFVSVTQSFNTTTSMGRLTLNVLLSFAQFEREVIGERVRDKIAASKKKGMWMGGHDPLGYQFLNKKLIPKEDEIRIVKTIFQTYLKFACVRKLKAELDKLKVISKTRTSSRGDSFGGKSYSRGALYQILKNPVYIGKIRHKKAIYDGLHEPILDLETWDKVQEMLNSGAATASTKNASRSSVGQNQNLLQGLLYDTDGTLYTPHYASKAGKRYHYYISQNLLQYRDHPKGIAARLPAGEIENIVTTATQEQFSSANKIAELLQLDIINDNDTINHCLQNAEKFQAADILRKCCQKIIIGPREVNIIIDVMQLRKLANQKLDLNLPTMPENPTYKITMPYHLSRSKRGNIRIDGIDVETNSNDPFNRPAHEIQNWVKGIVWRDWYFRGKPLKEIARQEKTDPRYVARLINESLAVR